MKQKDRRIYWILSFLSLAGYAWVGYNLLNGDHSATHTLCVFKNITGLPCPSCGITRSVLCLAHGDVAQALLINPLGLLAAVLLVVIPCWITIDLISGDQSLLRKFKSAEYTLRTRKLLYVPLIVLMVMNWGWNILKEL